MISDGATPTVGQKHSLICHVSEAENLDPVITYRWTKHNDTQTYYVVGTNSNILSFSSLRLSDAGSYTCEVTVNSRLLHDAINETSKQLELYIPGKCDPISSDYSLHTFIKYAYYTQFLSLW